MTKKELENEVVLLRKAIAELDRVVSGVLDIQSKTLAVVKRIYLELNGEGE